MTKEEFVKQRCEIDKITEEEFEKTYRVVDCNCGAYYCKGYRCLDLDGLLKENQKYKEVGNTYKKRCQLAIEYIESKKYEYGDEEQDNYIYDIGFDEVNELLDILKGMK